MKRGSRLARGLASLGLAAAIASFASLAGAAETPVSRRTAVGADVRWWSGDRTGSVVPIVPFVHYEVIPDLFLDADFAMAPQSGGNSFRGNEEEPGARFGIGNPTVGAHYAWTSPGAQMTYFAGARVGLPLASLGDLDSDRANDLASASSAHADFYRWVPELLPLVGTLGFEAHPTRGLWMRLPVDILVLFPTTDRRELKGGVVARFEIEGQSKAGVGGGWALQLVVSNGFRTRDEDRAQAAMEPYFVFDNDRFFARFGILFALDRPLGLFINEGAVITGNLQLGGHLP